MIVDINLLPYREAQREMAVRRFYVLLFATLLSAGLLVFSFHQIVSVRMDYQQARNDRLRTSIGELDRKLRNVADLRERKKQLLERKQLVEGLQQKRSEQARIFDGLSRQTPDGVYLRSVVGRNKDPHVLEIQGFSLSQTLVTKYMRMLAQADVFAKPSLISIEDVQTKGRRVKGFKLIVPVAPPLELGKVRTEQGGHRS